MSTDGTELPETAAEAFGLWPTPEQWVEVATSVLAHGTERQVTELAERSIANAKAAHDCKALKHAEFKDWADGHVCPGEEPVERHDEPTELTNVEKQAFDVILNAALSGELGVMRVVERVTGREAAVLVVRMDDPRGTSQRGKRHERDSTR